MKEAGVTASEALSAFATAKDVESQHRAIVDLVRSRRIHDIVSDGAFREGLARLADAVRTGSTPAERLTAIAALERAAAVSKPLRPLVDEHLRRAVVAPLEDLHALKDADDRLYAAKSWRAVRNGERYLDLLATAAVREELGEAIRKECIEGVVVLSTDVAAALDRLRSVLIGAKIATKKPGDSLGRRLKRLLQAVSDALAKSYRPVGRQAGRALALCVAFSARVHGRPDSAVVKASVVERIAALVHEMVRSGFSLAAEHRTYEALAVAQEWFKQNEWQDLCQSSDWMSRVQNDIGEALLLLARLGLTDDDLRRALDTVCGSSERADAVCRKMATENGDISREVRDWLVKARRRTRSAHAGESQARSIDQVLAELLLDMDRLAHAADVVKTNVLPEVSTVLSQSEGALTRLADMADVMANKLALARTWRRLRIRNQDVGREIEYSPREHLYRANGSPGRRVRLISPIVERITDDDVPQVILKGVVEPVASK